MEPFAVIIDEKNEERVVPTKWLSEDLKELLWPPYEDGDNIRRTIFNLEDPTSEWTAFPVVKFINW